MNITGRKCLFFRTQIEPGIGPMPKNAIHSKDMEIIELTPAGIYVKTKNDRNGQASEHLVPYANVQSVKLAPLEADAKVA